MLYIFLIGFLAGAFLNLMPCVLPILSLKLLALQKARDKAEVVKLATVTSLGVLSFMALLSAIFGLLKLLGTSLNWGFQMQMPWFITLLILLLSLMLLVFQGYVNLPIPQAFFTIGNSAGLFLNSFISGFLIVVFSATCSGPLIGSAISIALSGESWLNLPISLLGMGFGLSLPYILFAIFPNFGLFLRGKASLGKNIKDVAAAMMLVTILWLFYILSTQVGYVRTSAIFIIVLVATFFTRKKSNMLIFAASVPLVLGLGIFFQKNMKDVQELRSIVWEPFVEEKIEYYVNSGRVVLVSIDASWCITCKGNNLWTFDRPSTLIYLEENDIVAMKGDLTLPNEKIAKFLQSYGVYAVPFTAIYSHKYPKGKVLPPILTAETLFEELQEAK